MEHIIEVEALRKSYGAVEAVRGIDFYVEPGKLFAFLGPNGAGKSTTIDMICTFLRPDGGRITVDGFEVGREDVSIRRIIGAVFQDGVLDPLLTVRENLHARGSLYGLRGAALRSAAEQVCARTGLTELLQRPYGKLSGGQRRRCDIARALVHTPKILFLDEPTTGLDPQTRRNVWETITRIQRESGMTVFLTTHYMEEAAKADYVLVIDRGQIAAKGTPSALKEAYARDRLLLTGELPALAARLDALGRTYRTVGDSLELSLDSTLEALPLLEACRDSLRGFEVVRGTMDDAFLAITGKELRE